MERKYKFCFRCRRTITENEVERGLFVQAPNGMLCATCAQRLDEETDVKQTAGPSTPLRARPSEAEPPAKPRAKAVEEKPSSISPPERPWTPPAPQSGVGGPPAQWLDGIREHLEAIHRALIFEKSSPWNVLATIAQCLAIGMLILGAFNWADNPTRLLLVALVFQVMALTFFVRGK
jgi:hypothetical protein